MGHDENVTWHGKAVADLSREELEQAFKHLAEMYLEAEKQRSQQAKVTARVMGSALRSAGCIR